MATITPFVPNPQTPFQFSPTLDGNVYTVVITWNLFAQRFYFNLYQLDGTLVVSLPLIGSPDGVQLEGLEWSRSKAIATLPLPNNYRPGDTARLTVAGCSPDAYNGIYQCLIQNSSVLNYSLSADPGPATVLGTVVYNINLVAGYFNTSTLVFRQSSQQFEVTP